MKKVLALAVAAAALASANPAWAHDRFHFDRHGRKVYHRGGARIQITSAPVCAPVRRTVHYRQTAWSTPAQVLGGGVVINVSNANGSYTPVTLQREGGTYVGPRGERYLQLPTEEQLRQVYGLK